MRRLVFTVSLGCCRFYSSKDRNSVGGGNMGTTMLLCVSFRFSFAFYLLDEGSGINNLNAAKVFNVS